MIEVRKSRNRCQVQCWHAKKTAELKMRRANAASDEHASSKPGKRICDHCRYTSVFAAPGCVASRCIVCTTALAARAREWQRRKHLDSTCTVLPLLFSAVSLCRIAYSDWHQTEVSSANLLSRSLDAVARALCDHFGCDR